MKSRIQSLNEYTNYAQEITGRTSGSVMMSSLDIDGMAQNFQMTPKPVKVEFVTGIIDPGAKSFDLTLDLTDKMVFGATCANWDDYKGFVFLEQKAGGRAKSKIPVKEFRKWYDRDKLVIYNLMILICQEFYPNWIWTI